MSKSKGEVVVSVSIIPRLFEEKRVGLLGRERVQVPLAGPAVGLGDPGPGGAAEARNPVVGGPVVGPHVPIGSLAKPGMLD